MPKVWRFEAYSVLVTAPGKSGKVLKIDAAKRDIAKKINAQKTRKANLKDLLKDAKALEKSLIKGGLGNTVNAEKIEKARVKITKFSGLIAEADSRAEILKQLLAKIPDCSKPADPKISGSVHFFSGPYNNGANWYVFVVYLVDNTKITTNSYCAGLSGLSVKHTDKGWSGYITADTPATALTPKSNLCQIPFGFECIDPKNDAVIVFAAKSGPQSAGCTTSDCDLGTALAEAHAFYDGIIVSNFEPMDGSSACEK